VSHLGRRIRVLVVDDSPVYRELLVYLLSCDSELEVIGTAGDGIEAIARVRRSRPDVVTMDIEMPRMDGLEATRIIMETLPTPIVIVSASASPGGVVATFQALEAGALAFLEKPRGLGDEAAKKLIETLKLMAEIKLVRRWARRCAAQRAAAGPADGAELAPPMVVPASVELVAIGASTGGPLVLQSILAGLPRDFPVPLLVVQHISPGFAAGFAEWLEQSSAFRVRLAAEGDSLRPGYCYLAPDGLQLGVEARQSYLPRIRLLAEPAENGHRPSVSYLFRSAVQALGSSMVGVLLSGMGKDGALELKRMKDTGAVTIAQSRESSVVAGMPGEAINLGGATYVLAPELIAPMLCRLAGKGNALPGPCPAPDKR